MLTLPRLLRSLRLGREEGQVMPMFAAGIGAMLIMTGVVIDGGNLFQNRQSLQNAADASAIAAAEYLAAPTSSCQGATSIGGCAGVYADLNQAGNGKPLPACNIKDPSDPLYVTDTRAPSQAPGCYLYPYLPANAPAGASGNSYVEVWLTRKTSNFFGGLFPGFGTSTESARSIGTVTSGNPPPIAFAALDNSCGNHTLLIRSSGNLTVDSGIYVNSCSGQDGFDVFSANTGSPGSIAAPAIFTTGGWQVDKGTGVYVGPFPNPPLCALTPLSPTGGGKYSFPPPPTAPGCPLTGQNTTHCPGVGVGVAVCDPFAAFPTAPTPGPSSVGAFWTITKIKRVTTGPNSVATAYVAGGHGLPVGSSGESITISGVGYDFDGTYTVASVPDSTSFTYNNPSTTYPNVPIITAKQMCGGTATLTTNAPTTLSPGGPDTSVTVSGIDSFFNFTGGLAATPPACASATSPQFSYQPAWADGISHQALQQGTATLTVAGAPNGTTAGLAVKDTLSVTGLNPLLNAPASSPVTITALAGGTITYSVPGTVFSVSGGTIGDGTVSSGATVTLTTTTTNHFSPADTVMVSGSGDSRLNGTFNVITGGGTTVSYGIPSIKANSQNRAASGGTITITTGAAGGWPFRSGDHVTFPSASLAYAVANVPVTVNATKFSYPAPKFDTSSWSKSGTTVTITTASGHGLAKGDTVDVSGFAQAQACLNVTGATVLGVPTQTTFTYMVPSCSPAAGGNGSIKLVATASATNNSTAPAFEVSGSTTALCSNCVSEFIAANTPASGSVTLIDEQLNNDTGTFTPAWMSTSGVVNQVNPPGSSGNPFPDEISSGSHVLWPGTYYGGICVGAAAGSDCSNAGKTPRCNAIGGSTTTFVAYTPEVDLAADVPDNFDPTGSGTIQVTQSGISKGDVIAIDDEEMTVTEVSADGLTITVTREANGTEDGPHTKGAEVFQVVTTQNGTAYNPAVTVNAPAAGKTPAGITATQTSIPIQWGGGGAQANTDPVQVNDVIQIGDEDMLVTGETAAAASKATLTVTRGRNGTTAVPHSDKAPVLQATPGSTSSGASVTLEPGVYIMAGGGFSVCGAASVNVDTSTAPGGVMIYNTQDPAPNNTGYGALGQVDINTAGSVHLSPMTSGMYTGMTIFQDRSLALSSTACPHLTSSGWDIALQSAAALPASGELGSITGAIYAPYLHATLGDTMSGTSNLMVITSCFYLDGATSTFNHITNDPNNPLPGVTATLGG